MFYNRFMDKLFCLTRSLTRSVIIFYPRIFQFNLVRAVRRVIRKITSFTNILILGVIRRQVKGFARLFLNYDTVASSNLRIILVSLTNWHRHLFLPFFQWTVSRTVQVSRLNYNFSYVDGGY